MRKYDPSGNELWTSQFGTSADDRAYSVTIARDGNVIVTGYTEGILDSLGSTGTRDVYVRKFSSTGAALWTRQFGTSSIDYSWSIAADSFGSSFVAGYTQGVLPGQTNAGNTDAFVVKLLP